jgi:CBS domain-containing protein
MLTQKSMVDRLPVISDGEVVGLLSKVDLTAVFAEHLSGRFRVGDLMHYNPVTVFDYTPLTKVVEDMKGMGVKRVLVMSGDNLAGIISVRDLSLALFRQKRQQQSVDPRSVLTAEDIMSRNIITAAKSDDAAHAAQIMVEKEIGGIPVLDGRLDGIITRTDLLKGYQLA